MDESKNRFKEIAREEVGLIDRPNSEACYCKGATVMERVIPGGYIIYYHCATHDKHWQKITEKG